MPNHNQLAEQFADTQAEALTDRQSWNSTRVHKKVSDLVAQTVRSLVADNKIHLNKEDWGLAVYFEGGGPRLFSLPDVHITPHHLISLNFSDASQDKTIENVSCVTPVGGLTSMIDRAAWTILGEDAFVQRKAASIMQKIAKLEAEHCQKHEIGPMPAIAALAESKQIDIHRWREKNRNETPQDPRHLTKPPSL